MVSSENGAVSVPIALLVGISMSFGIGTWTLLHRWRVLTALQLRLDRCTGEAVQDTRKAFERIQLLNRAIRVARATLEASIVLPEAAEAAHEALKVAAAAQEALAGAWRAKRAFWVIRRGCGGSGDRASALPALPWTRDPPDVIGPKPMRWDSDSSTFRVQATNGTRRSAARLGPGKGVQDDGDEPRSWSVEWIRPAPG